MAETPQWTPYDVTKNVTDADKAKINGEQIFSMLQNQFYSNPANTNRMLINPQAAQMLPQTEGAKIMAMGRSGMALLGGTSPEFPFAAWATQHEPSLNTQMMQHAANIKFNTPVADPEIQRNLDTQFNDFINKDIYQEGADKFGNVNTVKSILEKGYANDNPQEREWFDKINKRMYAYEAGANLSKSIQAELNKIQEGGFEVSSQYKQALQDYQNVYGGKIDEDSYDKLLNIKHKIDGFFDIEKLAKAYAPPDFKWGENSFVTKAKEIDPKTGKETLIPREYTEWKIVNDKGQVTMDNDQFKGVVDNINNSLKLKGDDFGVPFGKEGTQAASANDEKRKQKIADYLSGKSTMSSTQTLRAAPRDINISVGGQAKETGAMYGAPETIQYGSGKDIFHTDATAYSIPETATELPPIEGVIPSTSALSETSDIKEGSKIGSVILAPMSVVDGKLYMVPNDNKSSTKDLFYAPMAVVHQPETKEEEVIDPVTHNPVIDSYTNKPKVRPVTTYKTMYVPLNKVANVLKANAKNKDVSDEMEQIIDKIYNDAVNQNDAYATKEAKDYFQKYFGISKTEILKSKTTKSAKETERITSGYTY